MSTHIPYEAPGFLKNAFNCPFCNAYAKQDWHDVAYMDSGYVRISLTKVAFCGRCGQYAIWQKEKMIHPDFAGIDLPNTDLSEDVLLDYQEAASIMQKSPRGAAALLRLAIQKLCIQLGEKGKDLNTDIGNLVKEGLPAKVQQSLDALRVIGNESVHPGQLDMKDDTETAKSLFRLVNFIAEKMITEPNEIDAIYEKIPDEKKQQIEKRDKKEDVL